MTFKPQAKCIVNPGQFFCVALTYKLVCWLTLFACQSRAECSGTAPEGGLPLNGLEWDCGRGGVEGFRENYAFVSAR